MCEQIANATAKGHLFFLAHSHVTCHVFVDCMKVCVVDCMKVCVVLHCDEIGMMTGFKDIKL